MSLSPSSSPVVHFPILRLFESKDGPKQPRSALFRNCQTCFHANFIHAHATEKKRKEDIKIHPKNTHRRSFTRSAALPARTCSRASNTDTVLTFCLHGEPVHPRLTRQARKSNLGAIISTVRTPRICPSVFFTRSAPLARCGGQRGERAGRLFVLVFSSSGKLHAPSCDTSTLRHPACGWECVTATHSRDVNQRGSTSTLTFTGLTGSQALAREKKAPPTRVSPSSGPTLQPRPDPADPPSALTRPRFSIDERTTNPPSPLPCV